MFLVAQFPIADARPTLECDTRRLSLPPWPLVQPGDFVRSTGPVRQRRLGGVPPWRGEGVFCDASRVLRFPPCLSSEPVISGDDRTSGFDCAFRRYSSDGFVVGRFELGFSGGKAGRKERPGFSGKELIKLLNAWLEFPISLPVWGDAEHRKCSDMGQAGRLLANHILWVTTRKPFLPSSLDPKWVRPGRPLLLIEFSMWEAEPPSSASIVDIGQHVGVELAHCRVSHHGVPVNVWMIGRKSRSVDKDSLRRLRLHLCRLHVEYECVRLILRHVTSRGLEEHCAQGLRIFLNKGIDLLSSSQKYGFDQDPILAAAYGAEEVMNQEERGTVLGMLSEKRVSEFRRIEEVVQSSPNVTNIVSGDKVIVASGGLSMSDYRFHVGGDFTGVVGSRNVVKESFQSIDNSQASAEVKDLLKQLTEAVALAASNMPQEKAEQSLRDFDAFRDEALSSEPRKSMLEMLGGVLAQTASIVGDIGAPVASLVTAVISLFA